MINTATAGCDVSIHEKWIDLSSDGHTTLGWGRLGRVAEADEEVLLAYLFAHALR